MFAFSPVFQRIWQSLSPADDADELVRRTVAHYREKDRSIREQLVEHKKLERNLPGLYHKQGEMTEEMYEKVRLFEQYGASRADAIAAVKDFEISLDTGSLGQEADDRRAVSEDTQDLIAAAMSLSGESKSAASGIRFCEVPMSAIQGGAAPAPVGDAVFLCVDTSLLVLWERRWIIHEELGAHLGAGSSIEDFRNLCSVIAGEPDIALRVLNSRWINSDRMFKALFDPRVTRLRVSMEEVRTRAMFVQLLLILHEIGHVVLGHTETIRTSLTSEGKLRGIGTEQRLLFEFSADAFAVAGLLSLGMPSNIIIPILSSVFMLFCYDERASQQAGVSAPWKAHPRAAERLHGCLKEVAKARDDYSAPSLRNVQKFMESHLTSVNWFRDALTKMELAAKKKGRAMSRDKEKPISKKRMTEVLAEQWISVRDAVDCYGVSESTVRRWARDKKIRSKSKPVLLVDQQELFLRVPFRGYDEQTSFDIKARMIRTRLIHFDHPEDDSPRLAASAGNVAKWIAVAAASGVVGSAAWEFVTENLPGLLKELYAVLDALLGVRPSERDVWDRVSDELKGMSDLNDRIRVWLADERLRDRS